MLVFCFFCQSAQYHSAVCYSSAGCHSAECHSLAEGNYAECHIMLIVILLNFILLNVDLALSVILLKCHSPAECCSYTQCHSAESHNVQNYIGYSVHNV